MIDKKKMKQEYKSIVRDKGVFAIKNTKTGRTFLAGTLNLYNFAGRQKTRLINGMHFNERLQKDWIELGEGAFTFEVLEKLKSNGDPQYDYDEDLRVLELIWFGKYQPASEKLYNENDKIRVV